MSYTVYLAEPIDQATNTGVYNLSSLIEQKLVDLGLNVYRPANAWRCGGDLAPAIQQVNNAALTRADLMVAYLPAGIPSIGVPIEIAMAASQRKSVLVVTPIKSYTLAGIEGVTTIDDLDDLEAIITATCKTLEQQQHPLRWMDLNDGRGKQKIDMSRPWAEVNQNHPHSWPIGLDGTTVPLTDRVFHIPERDLLPAMADPAPLVYQKHDSRTPDLQLSHDDDAGIDLYTVEDATIHGNDYAKISTGVRIKLPEGVFGWVVARSSTFEKYRLLVLPGIMDTGYRGPYFALVWNTQDTPVHIPAGTRLCQVVLLESVAPHYRPVEGLVPIDTTRGESGFGSSGTGRRSHRSWCGLDRDHGGLCQPGPADAGEGEKSEGRAD